MSQLENEPQVSGLTPNVAGALAYVLGPITGVLFLVIEKRNRFVRFHAAQSIAVSLVWVAASIVLTVLGAILAVIPIIGWLVGLLLTLALGLSGFVLWVVLMLRAFQGREWEVPLIGAQARRLLAGAPAIG
ncbi:MAG: DUF4870 domain-containing protein [Longimicrobiales bacterium]